MIFKDLVEINKKEKYKTAFKTVYNRARGKMNSFKS
jgi:hypothetical protein